MVCFVDKKPAKKLKIEESAEFDGQKPLQDKTNQSDAEFEDELLYGEALGVNPNVDSRAVVPLTQALVDRWSTWVKKGTNPERLSFLTSQYVLPEFLIPPKLNVEIIGFLKKSTIQRDEQLKQEQELLAHYLASLAGGEFILMRHEGLKNTEKQTKIELVSVLSESAETMAHVFYEKTLTRRGLIIRYIDSGEMKDLLRAQKECDEFLFGKDLKDKMRDLKMGKKTAKEFGVKDSTSKNNSAKDFLERRRNQPYRKNLPWNGQQSQSDRWSFRKYNPFPFSTNPSRQQPVRGRGRGLFRK